MTAEASVYHRWWAGVVGVMAGCLSLAVADVPMYKGAALSLCLFGGVVAAAGFLVPRLLTARTETVAPGADTAEPIPTSSGHNLFVNHSNGLQGRLRWLVDATILAALVVGLIVIGSALPGAEVPVVWVAPLAVLLWLVAGAVAADLTRIDQTSDGEVAAATLLRLGGRFLLGLLFLFLLLGIGSGHMASLLAALYALTGISALAWLQYRVRRRQWARGGAQVRGRLGRHWLLSALALLVVVAVLAVLTPTTVVLALANATWHAVGPVFAQPVVGLLGQTNTHYRRYQGGGSGGIHHYGRGRPAPPRTYHGHGGGSAGAWAQLLLWIPAVGALAYLGLAYWRHRFHGVPWRVALLGPLLAVWQHLRFALTWSLDVASAHLPDQLAILLPGAGREMPGGSRRRLGRLSPRERIGLYYLGALRNARRHGIPCPPWKTPRELVPAVGARVGDAQSYFADLSDVFVEARYSLHELSDAQADLARGDARRVRAALRDVRERGPSTSPDSVTTQISGPSL